MAGYSVKSVSAPVRSVIWSEENFASLWQFAIIQFYWKNAVLAHIVARHWFKPIIMPLKAGYQIGRKAE